MYYAQGEGGGCTPDAVRGRSGRRRTRKVKERREREGRGEGRGGGSGGGSMCVTCVAAITQSRGWLPGNAFQPPHTHTTLNQSPKPPCEISLHGVLFLPFYVALSLVPRLLPLPFSPSFYPTRRLANTAYCSPISTLILI